MTNHQRDCGCSRCLDAAAKTAAVDSVRGPRDPKPEQPPTHWHGSPCRRCGVRDSLHDFSVDHPFERQRKGGDR